MRHGLAAGLALAISFGGPALAADKPAGERGPDWLRRPLAKDLMAVWPAEPFKRGRGGKAIISCKVNRMGVLYDCVVDSEQPARLGFGAAALALTPQFLMRPALKEGAPAETTVRIPIIFRGFDRKEAMAATPELTHRVLADPPWISAPTLQEVAEAYPAKARAERIGGHATLNCIFTKTGTLRGCQTLRDEPNGYGFAKAARALASKFVGPTSLADSKSTSGADTQIRFTFAPEMLDGVIAPSRPVFLKAPTADEMLAGFPQSALKAGVMSARVVMTCKVIAGGRLDACTMLSEEPQGYGLGKATLPLASAFQLSPWSQDGVPLVGTDVRVPIRYAFEEAPPQTPSPKP
jgi:TonB family protein